MGWGWEVRLSKGVGVIRFTKDPEILPVAVGRMEYKGRVGVKQRHQLGDGCSLPWQR